MPKTPHSSWNLSSRHVALKAVPPRVLELVQRHVHDRLGPHRGSRSRSPPVVPIQRHGIADSAISASNSRARAGSDADDAPATGPRRRARASRRAPRRQRRPRSPTRRRPGDARLGERHRDARPRRSRAPPSTSPAPIAARTAACTRRSISRSSGGQPPAPAARAASTDTRCRRGSPRRVRAAPRDGPAPLNHCVASSVASSSRPTTPMIGVGRIAGRGSGAYPHGLIVEETLPPTTGSSSARHASAMPSIASANCQRISGRSGEPKFRQSVTPSGRPPAHETLRAASHTAMAAPRARVEEDLAAVAVGGDRDRAPRALDAQHGGVGAGQDQRVDPDLLVVLAERPLLGRDRRASPAARAAPRRSPAARAARAGSKRLALGEPGGRRVGFS